MSASEEQDKTIIMFDGLKLDWKESALRKVVTFYNEGMKASKLASYFRITLDEIFLVLLYLMREGQIEARQGGWIG